MKKPVDQLTETIQNKECYNCKTKENIILFDEPHGPECEFTWCIEHYVEINLRLDKNVKPDI